MNKICWTYLYSDTWSDSLFGKRKHVTKVLYIRREHRKEIKIMSYQIVSGNLSLRNTHFCIDKTNHSFSQSRIQENKMIRDHNDDKIKISSNLAVCFIASVGHIKRTHVYITSWVHAIVIKYNLWCTQYTNRI